MGSFDFFVHGFRAGDAGVADALMEHFGLERDLAEVFELSVPAVLVSGVPDRLLPAYREALERCGAAIQITESERPAREPSAEPPRLAAGVELELPLPVAARAPAAPVPQPHAQSPRATRQNAPPGPTILASEAAEAPARGPSPGATLAADSAAQPGPRRAPPPHAPPLHAAPTVAAQAGVAPPRKGNGGPAFPPERDTEEQRPPIAREAYSTDQFARRPVAAKPAAPGLMPQRASDIMKQAAERGQQAAQVDAAGRRISTEARALAAEIENARRLRAEARRRPAHPLSVDVQPSTPEAPPPRPTRPKRGK